MTKTCAKCKAEKPCTEFHRSNISPDGLRPRCKKCRLAEWNEYKSANAAKVNATNAAWAAKNVARRNATKVGWAKANKAKVNAAAAKWRENNRAAASAASAKWIAEHPEEQSEMNRKWLKENRAHQTAQQAKRKAQMILATPGWTNMVAVGEFYALAAIKTRLTGEPWEVDHQVPLRSKRVCGLHTHYNLQVIRKSENIRKHNRIWPDM